MGHVEIDPGEIFTIRLNRPEIRNAFNPQMINELTKAFEKAEKDAKIRIVVLRGQGKSFCAGADLEWMKSMAEYSKKENVKDSEKLFDMFKAARACSKPTIGILQGHVMGGGLGLAATCDFALAEKETQFCFSEVKLGLVPAVISSFVLEKMSYPHALRAMLSAETFSADQAMQWGLVSFVGSMSEVESDLQRLCQNLLRNGPEALRATKKIVQTIGRSINVRKKSASVIAERRVSPEGQEGLQSFLLRRQPKWVR